MSASKIFNESNRTRFTFNQNKTALTLLLPIIFNLIDETMNGSNAELMWFHQKYGMSRLIPILHYIKKKSITLLLLKM